MLAVNPEAFIGLEAFKERTAQLFKDVKSLTPVAGERVLVPGEPEMETKQRRLREGIEVPDETWAQILDLCRSLKIDLHLKPE
jgi:LDH2 family malate/lactate/ureidoglycolate dehydrogenase